MEPSRGHPLEAGQERADVPVYLVDPRKAVVVLGTGGHMRGHREVLHDAGISLVLVRVHDGSRADPVLEHRHGDVVGQGAPARDVEEEVVRVVERGHHADLLVADAPIPAPCVRMGLAGLRRHSIEAGALEALPEVELVELRAGPGLDLERGEVGEQALEHAQAHEPGCLVANPQPLRDLVAGQAVCEAGRILHPDGLVQLRGGEDAPGVPVAPDGATSAALPPLGPRPGPPVADAVAASACGARHVGMSMCVFMSSRWRIV